MPGSNILNEMQQTVMIFNKYTWSYTFVFPGQKPKQHFKINLEWNPLKSELIWLKILF